jgi:hypothetical protein
MQLENGTRLKDRYRIDDLLRHEDMGAVYRGTDLSTGSQVAITEHHILSVRLPVSPEEGETAAEESLGSFTSSEEVRERFEKEARSLADLDRPGIPKIVDFFDVAGQGQYLVMEYVAGRDLEEVLESGEALPARRPIEIGLELCGILEYLHARRPPVIHRDIKPSNIRITPAGRVVLVGFGVGREQSPGEMTLGAPSISPGYSPLEQYGGDVITDERSDIYSLGATLQALVTGEAPRPATERALSLPPRPAVAGSRTGEPALRAVLDRATALLPKDRFQSVAEFRKALEGLLPAPVVVPTTVKPAAIPPKQAAPATPVVAAPAKPLAPRKAASLKPAPAVMPPAPVKPAAEPTSPEAARRAPILGWLALPAALAGVVLLVMALTRTSPISSPDERPLAVFGRPDSVPSTPSPPATADLFGAPVTPATTDTAAEPPAPTPSVMAADTIDTAATVPPKMTPAPPKKKPAPPKEEASPTTTAIAPGVPETAVRILSTDGSAPTAVSLEWTASELPNFAAYEVYYARPSNDLVVPVYIRSGKGIRKRDATRLTVGNLKCGTTYAFKVRAVDRKGRYRDSENVRVTTRECAMSDTLVVSAKGDAGYISIEDALAAAGRTGRAKRIVVRPGRYVLNGAVALEGAVSIAGVGPRANVVVESGGTGCFVLSGTGGTLRGLTIRSASGSAVVIRGDASIEDCDISSPGTAVDVQIDADARIRHTRIHDSRGTGLLLGRSAEVRVESCTIAGNALGILVQQNARLVLLKSQVLRSRSGNGITVQGLGRALVSGCDVFDNRKAGVGLENGIAEIRDSRINKNRWYAVDCPGGDGSVNITGSTFVGNFPADIHPLCEKTDKRALVQ